MASDSSSVYYIEYAKSGRAACKGACQGLMPMGMLRFGTIINRGEYNKTTWRCFPHCMTKLVAKNCIKKYSSLELLGGMELLAPDDQKRVMDCIEQIERGEKVESWQNLESTNSNSKTQVRKGRKRANSEESEESEDTEESEESAESEESEDSEESEEEEKPRKRKAAVPTRKKTKASPPAKAKKPTAAAVAKKKKA